MWAGHGGRGGMVHCPVAEWLERRAEEHMVPVFPEHKTTRL